MLYPSIPGDKNFEAMIYDQIVQDSASGANRANERDPKPADRSVALIFEKFLAAFTDALDWIGTKIRFSANLKEPEGAHLQEKQKTADLFRQMNELRNASKFLGQSSHLINQESFRVRAQITMSQDLGDSQAKSSGRKLYSQRQIEGLQTDGQLPADFNEKQQMLKTLRTVADVTLQTKEETDQKIRSIQNSLSSQKALYHVEERGGLNLYETPEGNYRRIPKDDRGLMQILKRAVERLSPFKREVEAVVTIKEGLKELGIYGHGHLTLPNNVTRSRQDVDFLEYGGHDIGNIAKNASSIGFANKLDIADQIMEGIEYLHAINHVHGDLSPENILIYETSTEGQLEAKIAHFNQMQKMGPDQRKVSSGNEAFAPPERGLSQKGEVFSAALSLMVLFQGEVESLSEGDAIAAYVAQLKTDPSAAVNTLIYNLKSKASPALTEKIEAFGALLKEMTDSDPLKRPAMKEALQKYREIFPSNIRTVQSLIKDKTTKYYGENSRVFVKEQDKQSLFISPFQMTRDASGVRVTLDGKAQNFSSETGGSATEFDFIQALHERYGQSAFLNLSSLLQQSAATDYQQRFSEELGRQLHRNIQLGSVPGKAWEAKIDNFQENGEKMVKLALSFELETKMTPDDDIDDMPERLAFICTREIVLSEDDLNKDWMQIETLFVAPSLRVKDSMVELKN